MKKKLGVLAGLVLILFGLLPGCDQKRQEIRFADAGWDSAKFHNAVAGYIAESGYGYTWREVSGGTTVLHEGLLKDEVDVHMEVWTANIPAYEVDVAAGKLKEMGVNYDDNIQGIYVPRYVIEGDPERGIEPSAPDLHTVRDLQNYKDVFPDDEDPGKGRIYGSIPGWEADTVMYNKYKAYGLDHNYVYFRPGSDAALSAALTSAYEKGVPIASYYWEPTWLLGKYDFVLLEDEPYDPKLYPEGKTAFPSVRIAIATSNQFYEDNPDFCAFLSNYETSSALTSEALAHMQDTGASYEETAKWFLQQHDDLLDQWLTPDVAAKVRGAVQGENSINPLLDFPFAISLDLESVDAAVRGFSARFDFIFNAIKDSLTQVITGIQWILNLIPWWVLIAAVFAGGWFITGKLRTGIIYAVMLFFVGLMDLWLLMNETLSIVITAVLLSLLLGLPVGILISNSERANRIMRPILDTMQTMPVFVYLIPAILFFGLGKAPAVIATTIYAVVPVIRLTSHGIRQVDAEVVEAARAFGSTRFQTLFKVQIPQAMPTIMTGVNQTLMMAMAMVVTCSMIGASGLGMEVLISVNRIEIGRGIIAGSAIVIVAILMDRFTQGVVKKSEVKRRG